MAKKIDLEKIPGIGKKTAEKLEEVGFTDPMAIAVCSPSELARIAEIGEGQATKIIAAVRKMLEIGLERADKVWEKKQKMARITTSSKKLDKLIGGGIPTQAITEAFGPFGSGKTQVGFNLAVNVQLPKEKGGLNKECVWIDSENTFSPSRILQIAKAKNLDETTLKKIHVARVYNSEHQMLVVEKLPETLDLEKVGLIVIDSVTSHFRADFVGRGELAARQQKLNRHLHQLQKLADAFNLAVYITNQVLADPSVLFGDPTRAVGGHVLAHLCVAPNTLVISNDGIKEIEKVHNPNKLFGYLSKFDFFDLVYKTKTKRKNVVEINNSLVASKDHKVFVFNSNGFTEKRVGDLTSRDYLIIPRKIKVKTKRIKIPNLKVERVYVIENTTQVKKELRKIFRLKNDKACKKYLGIGSRHLRRILNQKYPTTISVIKRVEQLIGKVKYKEIETSKHKKVKVLKCLNSELAQFLGYYYGDGDRSFYNNLLRIREQDLDLLKFYRKLVTKIFGLKVKIKKVKDKECYEIKVANKYVANLMKYLVKNIKMLFFERKEIIKAFLRGLFDADGSVRGNVSLTLVDKKDLELVRLLLLRLGIYSSICKLGKYYRLNVSNKLFTKIGFTSSAKNSKLKFKDKKEKIRIPITRKLVSNVGKMIGIKYEFTHPESFVRYEELERLCKENKRMAWVFGNLLNFWFERVFSFKEVNANQLIDIETKCGNFLANCYLVHNSFYRLYLRKGRENTRVARLIDAPDLPEGEAVFRITEKGIEDA